jgi:peptide/nickel transport system permease protein
MARLPDAAARQAPGSILSTQHSALSTRLRGLLDLPLIPLAVLVGVVVVAALAPVLAPASPTAQSLPDRLTPPFWQEGGSTAHLLGTDHLGRDVLSRLIYGARVAVLVVVLTITAAAIIGTLAGLIAGYFGGVVDAVVMRIVDIQLALPALLFGVLLAAVYGAGLKSAIVIIVVWSWAGFARVIRSETLSLREREFVALARVAGMPWWWILWKHLLPNVFNTVLVLATLDVAVVIVFEASLSFLGLGVVPPTPAWGSMLAEGRNYLTVAWWLITMPGIAIFAVCLSGNLFGDWLRDRLDPRLRQTR